MGIDLPLVWTVLIGFGLTPRYRRAFVWALSSTGFRCEIWL